MNTDMTVGEAPDDAAIAALLGQDRRWGAYALCDLEPPYRANARYIGAWRDGGLAMGDRRAGGLVALALVYRFLNAAVLSFSGADDGVRAILAGISDLPPTPFLMVCDADLPALAARYRLEDIWMMRRMVVRVGASPPRRPAPDGVTLRPLTRADVPALLTLYRGETVTVSPSPDNGPLYGAFLDGELVAAAGTHAVSARHGVGIVGGVYTSPARRGRGLATATTGAVVAALADAGAREVALNVRADNAPALAAYTRLGFTPHVDFWEGDARLR